MRLIDVLDLIYTKRQEALLECPNEPLGSPDRAYWEGYSDGLDDLLLELEKELDV